MSVGLSGDAVPGFCLQAIKAYPWKTATSGLGPSKARTLNLSKTGRTVVVRNATIRDCHGIAAIAEAADNRFDLREYQLGRLPGLEVLVAEDRCGRLVGWLEGTLDGDVAEHLAHSDHPAPHAYIHSIAVVPQAARQGVGRSLIQVFVRTAMEAGLTWIALTPMPDEPEDAEPRVAFFSSCGFRPVDPADPCEGMVGDLQEVAARPF